MLGGEKKRQHKPLLHFILVYKQLNLLKISKILSQNLTKSYLQIKDQSSSVNSAVSNV